MDKKKKEEEDFNKGEDEIEYQKFPEGDILHNYKKEDNSERFDYLKGKYIFRFPFTITALKWGFSLGSFFALHTYLKKSLPNFL